MKAKSTGSAKAKSNVSFSMDEFAKALEQQNYEFRKGQVVQGKIYSYETEGSHKGVFVDVGGKSLAFVPMDEIPLPENTTLEEILPLDEDKQFLIVREQDADGQITLSLKQLEIKHAWDEVAEMQESGKVMQVSVTGINKGGITVDVNGLRGFIPKSHVVSKSNLPSLIGQSITVNFLEFDRESEKLIMSEKLASQATSFSMLDVGQLIEGTVSSVKTFGIFVDMSGISGLIHIKQITQNYHESVLKLFTVGQPIKALIVDLDPGRRRISLSTRILENYPGEILEKFAEVMESAEARAERVRKNIKAG